MTDSTPQRTISTLRLENDLRSVQDLWKNRGLRLFLSPEAGGLPGDGVVLGDSADGITFRLAANVLPGQPGEFPPAIPYLMLLWWDDVAGCELLDLQANQPWVAIRDGLLLRHRQGSVLAPLSPECWAYGDEVHSPGYELSGMLPDLDGSLTVSRLRRRVESRPIGMIRKQVADGFDSLISTYEDHGVFKTLMIPHEMMPDDWSHWLPMAMHAAARRGVLAVDDAAVERWLEFVNPAMVERINGREVCRWPAGLRPTDAAREQEPGFYPTGARLSAAAWVFLEVCSEEQARRVESRRITGSDPAAFKHEVVQRTGKRARRDDAPMVLPSVNLPFDPLVGPATVAEAASALGVDQSGLRKFLKRRGCSWTDESRADLWRWLKAERAERAAWSRIVGYRAAGGKNPDPVRNEWAARRWVSDQKRNGLGLADAFNLLIAKNQAAEDAGKPLVAPPIPPDDDAPSPMASRAEFDSASTWEQSDPSEGTTWGAPSAGTAEWYDELEPAHISRSMPGSQKAGPRVLSDPVLPAGVVLELGNEYRWMEDRRAAKLRLLTEGEPDPIAGRLADIEADRLAAERAQPEVKSDPPRRLAG